MTIHEIVAFVIDTFEGHFYTDDPVDTGGATKFGITRRTLQYYRRKISRTPDLIVSKQDVKDLSREEAIACGVFVFAVEPKIDQISDWRLQLITYDYGFHSGQPRAISDLQTLIGATPDGLIGPQTLVAVAAMSSAWFLPLRLLTLREEFMQEIMLKRHTQRRFMLGWWIRTTKLQRLVLAPEEMAA